MASRLDFSQIRSLYIGTSASQTVPTNNLIVDGNVLIGTTTDVGEKLQVVGNAVITTGTFGLATNPFRLQSSSGDARSVGQFVGDEAVYNTASGTNTVNGSIAGIKFNWYSDNWMLSATRTGGADIEGLVISRNGTERLVIGIGGNVGIGTTNPSFKLDVTGAVRFSNELYVDGVWSTSYGPRNSGDPIKFVNWSATELVRINTTDGNVGIGTTTPGSLLHIGTYASAGKYVNSETLPTTPANHLITLAPPSTGGYYGGGIAWSEGTNVAASINAYDAGSGGALGLVFSTGNNSTLSERMRITDGGNVLIGTTTDNGYKLRVSGQGYFDSVVTMYTGFSSYTTDGLFNANAIYGSVFTPSGNSRIRFGYFDQGGGQYWGRIGFNGSTNWNIGTAAGGESFQIGIGNDSSAALLINNAGQVGIGTTNPVEKLTIDGTASGAYVRISNAASGDISSGFMIYNGNNLDTQIYTNPTFGNTTFLTREDLAIRAGGSQRMAIKSNGNVLIGTTTDAGYKLYVNGTGFFNNVLRASAANTFPIRAIATSGGVSRISFEDDVNQANDAVWVGSEGYNLCFGSSFSEQARISSNGNLLIGTTTDSGFKLRVNGEIYADDDIRIPNTFAIGLNGTDNNWRIGRNTITDTGWLTSNTLQIVVFGSSSGQGFQVVNSNGTALFEIDGVQGYTRITATLGVGVNPSGTTGRIDAANDIVAYSSSDRRLKENIKPIENALDKVKALTGVEFDWKSEHKDAHGYEGHDTGIIAQEVQEVMPTAVRTNDTGYLAVRYEKLIGLLIEANKELAEQVANQQSQIDELKKLMK